MSNEYPQTLINAVLDHAEVRSLSATDALAILRSQVMQAAKWRKQAYKDAETQHTLDKRMRAYACVGIVYAADGRACISESVFDIHGLASVDRAMHRLVSWAIPNAAVSTWNSDGRMRGARVALSSQGVATFRWEALKGGNMAEVHVHEDEGRAQAHLSDLIEQYKGNTFQPGTLDKVLNLVRKPKLSE